MKSYKKTFLVLLGAGLLVGTLWPMRWDLVMALPATDAQTLEVDGGRLLSAGKPFDGRLRETNGHAVTVTPVTDGLRDGPAVTMIDGRLMSVVPWVRGVKEGESQTYDPETGVVVERADWHEGLLHGMRLSFGKGGQLLKRETFAGGRAEGLTTVYHDNGSVASETAYVAGKRQGPVKIYSDKGVLLSDTMMSGDVRHGLFTLYFEETGTPAVRGTYENDAFQGPVTTWHPDGGYEIRTYDRGVETGEVEHYDASGQRIAILSTEDGKPSDELIQNPESPAVAMETEEQLKDAEGQ